MEGYVKENELKIENDDYLEKILEIREQIEENDERIVSKIKLENEKNKEEIMKKLKKNLENKKFASALDNVSKFQYLIGIDEAIMAQSDRNGN